MGEMTIASGEQRIRMCWGESVFIILRGEPSSGQSRVVCDAAAWGGTILSMLLNWIMPCSLTNKFPTALTPVFHLAKGTPRSRETAFWTARISDASLVSTAAKPRQYAACWDGFWQARVSSEIVGSLIQCCLIALISSCSLASVTPSFLYFKSPVFPLFVLAF